MINLQLAEKQGLSTETILKIERLHQFREVLHNNLPLLLGANQRGLMYEIGQTLFKVELELQELWGWKQDSKYYEFWHTPCCSCPVSDNRERYPTGRYIISGDCWLHSKEEA